MAQWDQREKTDRKEKPQGWPVVLVPSVCLVFSSCIKHLAAHLKYAYAATFINLFDIFCADIYYSIEPCEWPGEVCDCVKFKRIFLHTPNYLRNTMSQYFLEPHSLLGLRKRCSQVIFMQCCRHKRKILPVKGCAVHRLYILHEVLSCVIQQRMPVLLFCHTLRCCPSFARVGLPAFGSVLWPTECSRWCSRTYLFHHNVCVEAIDHTKVTSLAVTVFLIGVGC